MRLVEHPHAVITESDLPCPFFNNIFSAIVPESGAEPVVDDLVGRFQLRSAPCFWWSGPVNHDERVAAILERRGFVPAFEAAAMALDLADLPARDRQKVEIFEVGTEGQLADWSRTCTSAFEFDDALSGWWNELFASIPHGDSSPLRHYLASVDSTPVGTASAYIEDGIVGLASVGVRAAYRRQGIASAMTLAVLQSAHHRGSQLATLFSSPMATSMYQRLGFRRYGTGYCYLWSPKSNGETPNH